MRAVAAKGKREPVEAWRVARHDRRRRRRSRGGSTRRSSGATHELAFLREELDDGRSRATCRLVTVFGAAGIGKSRLAAELARRASATTRPCSPARCLPYGDGITFLPLTELVQSAGGEEAIGAPSRASPTAR